MADYTIAMHSTGEGEFCWRMSSGVFEVCRSLRNYPNEADCAASMRAAASSFPENRVTLLMLQSEPEPEETQDPPPQTGVLELD